MKQQRDRRAFLKTLAAGGAAVAYPAARATSLARALEPEATAKALSTPLAGTRVVAQMPPAPSTRPHAPLTVYLHASGGSEGPYGDLVTAAGDASMSPAPGEALTWRVKGSASYPAKSATTTVLLPRDSITIGGARLETTWFGYVPTGSGKQAMPYTERKLDAMIADTLARYPNIDPAQVTLVGNGMGGSGCATYGMRRAGTFAAIRCTLPRWRGTSVLVLGKGLVDGTPYTCDGVPFRDRVDMVKYVANPANDVPPLLWAFGSRGAAPWQEHKDMIAALRASGRAFAVRWFDAGDDASVTAQGTAELASYDGSYRLGRGYPVFSNSSADTPLDQRSGGINIGFAFRNVVETATSFTVDVTNVAGPATVDVTPRSKVFTAASAQRVTIAAANAWVTVTFGVAKPADPAPATTAAAVRTPLNQDALVAFLAAHQSGPYERFQRNLCITTPTAKLDFQRRAYPGGVPAPLAYPQYKLMVSPIGAAGAVLPAVERGRYTRTGTESQGTFNATFGPEDGCIAVARIVPCDAHGAEVPVDIDVESYAPHLFWLDRNGTARNFPLYFKQNGNFEWNGGFDHFYSLHHKTDLARPLPLAPRTAPFTPFATKAPKGSFTRVNYAPPSVQGNLWYPTYTDRGILVTANKQAYFQADYRSLHPVLPLVDGPRGIAATSHTLTIWWGRNNKLYGSSPHSFWVVDSTGTRRTLIGLRNKTPVYWEDTRPGHPNVEIVGDWDASIPVSERFPYKSWFSVFDPDTTKPDPNAAPVTDAVSSVPENPHFAPGPVAFIGDVHGYVLRAQFDFKDHAVPAKVTRFIKVSDPFGGALKDGILYVAERSAHRISKWDVKTGNYLGAVLEDKSAAGLGALDAVDTWRPNGGVTLAQLRARQIVAPEGLAIMDDWLYWGSLAQQEVRRVNLKSGKVQVCLRYPIYVPQSHFINIAVSPGTFGPRHTVFACSFDNQYYSRPRAWCPKDGADAADGTALTHTDYWDWSYFSYYPDGAGDTAVDVYPMCIAVGENGGLAVGGTQEALATWHLSEAGDQKPDTNIMNAALKEWRGAGMDLVWGHWGNGIEKYALPFGQSRNIDYWLKAIGH